MKFKFLNEKYEIDDFSDNTEILSTLTKSVFQFSGIRNDFIFLHVNCFGMSFQTLHEKFNEYYHRLEEDIDEILEMIGMYSSSEVSNNFNLNNNLDYESIDLETVQYDEEFLVESARNLISKLLLNFDFIRESLEKNQNNALVSKIDEMAEFWVKENSYILKRFIS